LRKYVGDAVEVADSSAGMHILAWLPGLKHAAARELVERARTKGLGLYLIAPYFLKASPSPGVLLGFADLPAADLDAAMRLFGECLRAAR
jgi:GntR family transcriptional regulator/MocR family aminotransferase